MARSRAEDYGEKQQRIRDCAAELFAARGFEATSTADIALDGGFSKALIYHYFRSKEEILQDLLEAHMDRLLAAVEGSLADPGGPHSRLRSFVRAHMGIYATSRARHILLLNELDALPRRGRAAIVAKQRRLIGLAADLFADLAPALRGNARLRTPVAMSFYGMINWTCTWYRPNGPVGPEEFADLACDLLLNGLTGRFGALSGA
jgi:AcrR family transcriptional regulator